MGEAAQFSGFDKQTLPFLKALGFHQNREWFHENKALYQTVVKNPMGDLVDDLTERFAKAKIPLKGSRKTSIYRVNRDVRFSKNKDPYVTHGSFLLTRSGDKKENGFLYLHFSNERSFIATGFYALDGDEMRAMRDLIIREQDRFAKIVSSMERHGYQLNISENLKRNPRGFESVEGEPLQSWIRAKNHTFMEELESGDLLKPELADRMFLLAQRSMDFLNFGWRAIDPLREINEG